MSLVCRPTSCYLVRVVHHWCTITGCSAIMQRTHPCVGSLLLIFGTSPSRRRLEPDESPIVYLSGEISYRRYRILFAAFDRGIRTMNPRTARPVGRYPRSYQKCQLIPCHQRLFRQSSRPQGQLRPIFHQRRGHVLSCTMDGHLYCRCLWSFRDSPTRILCSPVSSLSWSLHSLNRHLRSDARPRFVLIWTLFLPRGPDRVTVTYQLLRRTE